MANETTEREKLEAVIAQLKLDLGRSRNDGYAVTALRREIDKQIAKIEGAGWPPGYELPDLAVLKLLRKITYSDNADMFGKGVRP